MTRCCSRCGPDAFSDAGASQCGFCTPGIIMRLAALVRAQDRRRPRTTWPLLLRPTSADAPGGGRSSTQLDGPAGANSPAGAGWLLQASEEHKSELAAPGPGHPARDLEAADRFASRSRDVAPACRTRDCCGLGGFADDSAPDGALVAVPDGEGGWSVAEHPDRGSRRLVEEGAGPQLRCARCPGRSRFPPATGRSRYAPPSWNRPTWSRTRRGVSLGESRRRL